MSAEETATLSSVAGAAGSGSVEGVSTAPAESTAAGDANATEEKTPAPSGDSEVKDSTKPEKPEGSGPKPTASTRRKGPFKLKQKLQKADYWIDL